MCQSCNTGFELNMDNTACDGMWRELTVARTTRLRLQLERDSNQHALPSSLTCARIHMLCVYMCAACNIAQAVSYSSGCEVSACTTGWEVSDDQNQCDANVCLCPDGVPASGEACTVDGANMCQSCNTGFELSADNTACDGKNDAFASSFRF